MHKHCNSKLGVEHPNDDQIQLRKEHFRDETSASIDKNSEIAFDYRDKNLF